MLLKKVTVPVGTFVRLINAGVTVAVKVIAWFGNDVAVVAPGALEELTVVVVLARRTVWTTGLEIAPPKFASPAYVAVTVWVPAVGNEYKQFGIIPNVVIGNVQLGIGVAPSR